MILEVGVIVNILPKQTIIQFPRTFGGFFIIYDYNNYRYRAYRLFTGQPFKRRSFATKIFGVDSKAEHVDKALKLGRIDEIMKMAEAISKSKLIVLAIPVDATLNLLPELLNKIAN